MSIATFGLGAKDFALPTFGLTASTDTVIVTPPVPGRTYRKRSAAGSGNQTDQKLETPADYWAKIQKAIEQAKLDEYTHRIYNYHASGGMHFDRFASATAIGLLHRKKPSLLTPLTYDGNTILLYSPNADDLLVPLSPQPVQERTTLKGNIIVEATPVTALSGSGQVSFHSPHMQKLHEEDALLISGELGAVYIASEEELEALILLNLL